MKKYSIGVDFGTLSARAALIDISNGDQVARSEGKYPHGVMGAEEFSLSSAMDVAYQHPLDYIEVLKNTVRRVMSDSGVLSEQVSSIGIDFTACTVLPAKFDGTPICTLPEFKSCPDAYAKLWKHHGAEEEAKYLTSVAEARGEKWLEMYGGKISSEWLLPKLYETVKNSPEVISEAQIFIEAADWLVRLLTGSKIRNSCMAGFKACWNNRDLYPSEEYLRAADSRLAEAFNKLIDGEVKPSGSLAGKLTEEWAQELGLTTECKMCVPIIDAHATLPSSGIVDKNQLMLILGTSGCHIIMSDKDLNIKGIAGKVYGGIVDGLVAYEAGQSAFGDMFAWFADNMLHDSVRREAEMAGVPVLDHLSEKAARLAVGEGGVCVLDWWNGNRTPYMDPNLSGTIVGLTLSTRPEHIYRGMLEACAFGTRAIVDLMTDGGIEIDSVVASGGIPAKNPLMMQIMADVLGLPVKISSSTEAGAKGCAIMASVAAGDYPSIIEASAAMADPCRVIYAPNMENHEKYKELYSIYRTLSAQFASSDVMKRLRRL